MLVFHGVIEYDENAKVVDEDKQAGRDLGRMIKDANAAAQKTFFVRGPQDVASMPFPNTKQRAGYYEGKLKSIMADSGTNPASTVGDYALGMGKRVLLEEAKKAKIDLPEISVDGLARRLADIDKSYSIPNIKKEVLPWSPIFVVLF